MIYLVLVKNPFQIKDSKEEKQLTFIPENTLENYIRSVALVDMETISVSVNGVEVDDYTMILEDRDFVVVCPKVNKSALRVIAMVALTYVAFAAGGWAATGKWGAAMSTWGTGTSLLLGQITAMAVMFVGGLLINSLLGTGVKSETYDQSTTYGWDTDDNSTRQGGALPITYGTVRITGQVIAQHVYSSSDNDDQYLNMLLCGGEGEADSITDIKIDDNPISYYDDVSAEIRLGTNDQTCMKYFTETYSDQSLSYELNNDGVWRTSQVQGNGASALELLVQCPNGLYYSNDNGGLDKTTVKVQAQFREVGTEEWIPAIGNGLIRVANKLAGQVAPPATKAVVGGKSNIDLVSGRNIIENIVGYFSDKIGFTLVSAYGWNTKDSRANMRITQIEPLRGCSGGEVFTIKVEEVSSVLVHAHNPRWAVSDWNPDVYKNAVTKLGVYSSVNGFLGYVAPNTYWSGGGIAFLATAMNAPAYEYYNEDIGEYVSRPEGQSYVGDVYTIEISERVPELEITGATQDAIRKTIRINGLDETKSYEARVLCSYKKDTTSRYCNKVYWTQMSQVFDEQFTYPNSILIGLRALATDQLSGSKPTISWLQTRLKIYIWNPYTGQYEIKRADNPAWACYDVLHRCRKLKNIHTGVYEYDVSGAPVERFIYDEFLAWATFCDDNGLTVNLHFDVADDINAQLARLEEMGRGKVFRRGTRYGCMWDGASDMVQLFTVSNIFQDSFSEDFLALTERANAVEITFFNEDKDFQQDVITVYDSSYDETDRMVNPAQKTLYGCTTASRALREGRYLMRLTNHLIRTVAIEVDVDAIACQVGSVIGIQHDVPQWGVGGRVISYDAETRTMVLDKEVNLVLGKQYTVMCRLVDEANVREVFDYKTFTASTTETTNTIVFPEAWTIAPEAETIYTFGETGKSFKLFRVLNITRSQDLKRTIHGLEYIPEVYNEDEPIPPQITYAPLASQDPVINLKAVPNYVISKTGIISPEINVSWRASKNTAPDYYMVTAYGESGQTYSASRVYTTNYTFPNVKMDVYSVKVTAVYGGLSKDNTVGNVDCSEKTTPPNDVQNLTLVQDSSYPHILHITWDAIANYDVAGYELRTGAETWSASTVLQSDLIVGTSYDLTVMTSGTKYIHIKAKDTSGNYSIDATTCSIIMVNVEPDSITGFEVEQLL